MLDSKFIRIALLFVPALTALDAAAETLRVGPGQQFERPSQAAIVARDGDTVLITPGRYVDCAVWRFPGVIIAADVAPGLVAASASAASAKTRSTAPHDSNPGRGQVEITGPACGGKALFVTAAPRLTIIGITFRGAQV